ncbi:Zinc finger AN1 and C2H2 domain-containing stress-associated protein 16 [Hibiscus syriacus]|uniref:Zinc finger AN1 and C2H2 domain-containing stress-associated protein 16 n=1 Tax=Hibiscus syriacus TaxID=106335 RepID=A0A6A2ZUG9_HIBSY|nr:zinc finger AN1 and C2H2 domain-containing stress-associated protein 11-like [Hibiscus syriacus]KAE8694792.1 Zinc finger AN1 and C2H2 domain-containing stress-associated protein 16 [Hibiscus syriacus]
MGTPEFPDLGRHCSIQHCKQIDFLPFTCDRCNLCYCLEHRSYIKHQCPKGDNNGVTVVICPLCAKGVRLVPNEDPNISWESHVNTECDPSNYEKVVKKKKCPVPRCREALTFSNTINCRDCGVDHCLKHRFGLDHNCVGPKKPTGAPATSLSNWVTRFLNVGTSFRENQQSGSDSSSGKVEECRQCRVKFSSVTALVEHVKKVHEKNNQSRVLKMSIDVCPKCSKGFRDPVALVEHVERDHGGTSRA